MKFSDPILNQLVKKYPAPDFLDRSIYLFEDLIEHIISQQLSVKAADTIYKRFLGLFEQKGNSPTPQQILVTPDQDIRSVGISFSKITYIKSVAEAFATNKISVQKIKYVSDEEAIEELTKIKGVGKWTAEMILIFTLNRSDVFSLGDAGLRRAIKNLYSVTEEKEILLLSDTWKPYRSHASWYLWQNLENIPH